MKFFGKGIAWNHELDKPLCKFIGGELETEDQKVIEKLKKLGYTVDEEKVVNRKTNKKGAE